VSPNLLDRQFTAAAPNRKWAADFTYLWTAEGWLYVAVVLDLFSRRIVGWSMQPRMTAQLVADALLMALWRRGTPLQLLHHSDRGSQYSCEQFQQLLAVQGIVCSMSLKGDVWDNSAMESFFSSLKTERTARKVYRTRAEAKADVFDYIERSTTPTAAIPPWATSARWSPRREIPSARRLNQLKILSTKPGAGHL
jgi:putative transposase